MMSVFSTVLQPLTPPLPVTGLAFPVTGLTHVTRERVLQGITKMCQGDPSLQVFIQARHESCAVQGSCKSVNTMLTWGTGISESPAYTCSPLVKDDPAVSSFLPQTTQAHTVGSSKARKASAVDSQSVAQQLRFDVTAAITLFHACSSTMRVQVAGKTSF